MNPGPDDESHDLSAIHRVLSGEPEAFRSIVEAHQTRLFRFCLSRTRNQDAAADATQEIFLRVYRSLATYRMGHSFKTWLFAIAANYLRTRWKRRQADTARLALVWEPEPTDVNDPEADVLAAESAEAVHWALGELKEELSTPLYLYYFEGLGVAEIAEVLNLGPENVKTRLFRGRKKIRALLEREQPRGPWGGSHP